MAQVTLDDYAEVAQDAQLVTGTHDIDAKTFQIQAEPIRLASHVWIAASAFVGPGVTANEGSVLGACAVTFRDLEPWTVYVGNPAKAVKQRRNFTLDET
jgi:putative colanic acid biosynthesis acetyltransferase WcaF